MVRLKIDTIEDVKREIGNYFEIMRWLPDIQRPKCKTTDFYRVAIAPVNEEDCLYSRPVITSEEIEQAWFMDDHFMSPPVLMPNEYVFLRDFLSPLPKKVVAHNHRKSRTEIYRWADRLFNRILDKAVDR